MSSDYFLFFFPQGMFFSVYFTFFRFGFFLLAEALALRVELAKIADACFMLTPCLRAIFCATALKPGCFVAMFYSFYAIDDIVVTAVVQAESE